MPYSIERILRRETPSGWRVSGSGDGPYAASSPDGSMAVQVEPDGYGGFTVELHRGGKVFSKRHADGPADLGPAVSGAVDYVTGSPPQTVAKKDRGMFDDLF